MKTAHQPERNRALSTLIGEGLGPGSLVGVAIPLAWRLGMKGLIPRLGGAGEPVATSTCYRPTSGAQEDQHPSAVWLPVHG